MNERGVENREIEKNARGIRRLEIALGLVALSFYLLCLASAGALADEGANKTVAVAVLKPEERNGDYLKNVAGAPAPEASVNSMIFDAMISNEMKSRYESFGKNYEEREHYQLNDYGDFLRYQEANRNLVEWTIKRLMQHHFESTLKNRVEQSAKRASSESSSKEVKAAASAVMTISKVQRALSNTTLNFSESTKTRFKYDFPSGVMRMGMTSPLVDATLDYRLRPVDPTPGAVSQPEKLSLGVSRNFSSLRASSNARYGLVSKTVNYGMSKQVVGPLSAQVDQVHNMRDTSKSETVGRLSLGLTF